MQERSTTYLGKLIANQLTRGDSYKKLKKTVVINILNFNYFKRNSYHMIAHMKFENTNIKEYVDMGYDKEEQIATNKLEMHFIELPKFKKKNPETKEKIEQWLWVLIGKEDKINMAKKENKQIKEAVEILDEMSMDKKERERYEAILKAEFNYNTSMQNIKEEGIKEGINKGIIQGKESNKIEIAKKLLELNIEIEKIVKATGLSKEEVEELKQ